MIGMKRLMLVLAIAPALAFAGANWPQWRGPNLNGTSSATGLPTSWSTTENVICPTKLPSWAAATPIIWDATVFVTSAE